MVAFDSNNSANNKSNDNAPRFSGSDWAGRAGQVWTENQVFLDRMLARPGQRALETASPKPGEQVLEIGCGAGAMTLELLRMVTSGVEARSGLESWSWSGSGPGLDTGTDTDIGTDTNTVTGTNTGTGTDTDTGGGVGAGRDGHVTAVDLSPRLLARARERIGVGQPVTLINEDAARVELPESSYDLLFSRFGVMFFADPVSAFAHLRRFMKPGGRVVFVCWRALKENEWLSLPLSVAREKLDISVDVEEGAQGPFAFADADRVREILSAAGFGSITLQAFDTPLVYGSAASSETAIAEALSLTLKIGPVANLLSQVPLEEQQPVVDAMQKMFAERVTTQALPVSERSAVQRGARHAIEMGGAIWVVSALNR